MAGMSLPPGLEGDVNRHSVRPKTRTTRRFYAMKTIERIMPFPALPTVLCAGLAVLLLWSVPAIAVQPTLTAAPIVRAAPAPAVQTPLNPTKIPQFRQPLDVLDVTGATGIPVAVGTKDPVTGNQVIDVSICEYQTNVLPPGTPVVGAVAGVAPATWVWGYQEGAACTPGLQPRSYLGPVVLANRHTPTQMNYYNRLPGANVANVKAYTTSTDQTLIWGDPLSLNTAPPPINFNVPVGTALPELNLCWQAAQAFVPGVSVMPAPCLNNYGFLGLQAVPPPASYGSPVPASVHIHGGEVPSVVDGGPDSWWTRNGVFGHGYYSKGGTNDATAGKAVYVYPNGQEAAPIWFHDHMLGATRLNVYAGLAGGYIITEPASTLAKGLHPLGLADATWVPPVGQTENDRPLADLTVPLIIQDRMFDTNGQLFFPNVGINPEHPYWVPEFVGNTILVNGKTWPYFAVQPKRYRFLFLNGSNARAYELFLMSKTTGLKGPSMWVIGNDQGYLDAPREINPNLKPNDKLAIMPGERYEVIVDFSGVAGQTLEMRNTARTPWVGGAPVNGNTTGKVMQFRVAATPVVDKTFNPAALPAPAIRVNPADGLPKPMVRLTTALGTTPAAGVTIHKTRRLTLNEAIGAGGPLEVLVNNTLYDGSKPRLYNDFTPINTMWNTSYYSELPHEGETELWEILNLTADAHPIHPHLVAFQVLNRQGLDVKGYLAAYNTALTAAGLPLDGAGPPLDYNSSGAIGCAVTAPGRGDPRYSGLNPQCVLGGNPDPALTLSLVGLPVPPTPQEIGWKDTVQALPNMVTRILVRFAKPDLPAVTLADAAGYDFSPNHGHGYVWHCHIIDHEDNEMMRPFTVNDNALYPRNFLIGVNY
ncbi:multicopper oxidase, type 2 [Syntrophobacter fumaroxidans MPOB]|uniref:Multicopper oxidase, type 2 n=2 Tax=Syntrophobacter TaxID=29526 RepID=A0LKH8_SYNFM|nr:multicopper oxidase, type 2 [Syntrophobacter fumaroxidans MPOB]